MKTDDDVPHFTLLGRQALAVMKRLTEHRERKHREGSESNCETQAEQATDDHAGHEIVNELHQPSPRI
jgi:hypothetical protein